MVNKLVLYSVLPCWLQNLAISLHGYNLKKQRFNDDFYRILEFLDSTKGWSEEQIRAYKEENLHKIIYHAFNHCAYYRQKYQNVGLSPDDFKSINDLQKFPILTKEEIRSHWGGMIADNFRKSDLILSHTSGSTGKALNFYWTKQSIPYYWAIDQRYKNRFGFVLGQKCLNCTGHPIVPIKIHNPPYWRYDFILKRYFLNMHQISDKKINDIVSFLNSESINYYVGYPSILVALASEIEFGNIKLERIPKHIFIGAEKLYEQQKNVLERVFKGVQIHELYSFSEEAAVATHCIKSVYHEDFEIGHMELDKMEIISTGVKGEVLATGFANYGMPFIRYQNGDTAVFSDKKCSCGLNSQVISDILVINVIFK